MCSGDLAFRVRIESSVPSPLGTGTKLPNEAEDSSHRECTSGQQRMHTHRTGLPEPKPDEHGRCGNSTCPNQ